MVNVKTRELLEQLRFPKDAKLWGDVSCFCWEEIGGLAGASVVTEVCDAARELGWEVKADLTKTPSAMGWAFTLHDPAGGYFIIARKMYGETKEDNQFSLYLSFPCVSYR